jgi:hypothetical protein
VRIAVRARGFTLICLLSITVGVAGCDPTVPDSGRSPSSAAIPSPSAPPLARPCSFLTQPIAARITGDTTMANRAHDVTEAGSGYVACIFMDPGDEANSAGVQLKRVPSGVSESVLRDAATFFSSGEPVQPFHSFTVTGIGDSALGETTPGVAFIVFSRGDLLIYVGASSASVSGGALRAGILDLATEVAAAL